VWNFYHIAKNTFRESLREPIFFILLASALFMIGLFPSFSMFVFREQIKLVIDSSMATTMVFGLVASVLCASHTITREMRNGTVLLLMSKPVYRWSFILAKIAGITMALTVFVFICNTASLISVRIAKDQFRLDFTAMYIYFAIIFFSAFAGGLRNYFSRTSFASTAIVTLLVILPAYAFLLNFIPVHGKPLPLRLDMIPALLLIFFSVWTMGTVTVLFSTRLDVVANLTVSSLIFFLGLVSNYFLAEKASSGFISALLYAVIPNWQFFWMADAISGNKQIPSAYIAYAFLYVLLYMTFCSAWAVAMFQNRELARDSR
jgi:hypothetical protein